MKIQQNYREGKLFDKTFREYPPGKRLCKFRLGFQDIDGVRKHIFNEDISLQFPYVQFWEVQIAYAEFLGFTCSSEPCTELNLKTLILPNTNEDGLACVGASEWTPFDVKISMFWFNFFNGGMAYDHEVFMQKLQLWRSNDEIPFADLKMKSFKFIIGAS